ncbi:MAG: low molecular weight protein-tyrosine-phosphatase [Pseudomonadales bacterium]
MSTGILFVCLGNICRSPMAQGVLETLIAERKLSDKLHADSCGTAAFNVGKSPDPRAIASANKAGYDIGSQIARQIEDDDYHQHQYIIVMDRQNLINVESWAPAAHRANISLMMDHHPSARGNSQVPDPYYGEDQAFDQIINTIEIACKGLLNTICEQQQLRNSI